MYKKFLPLFTLLLLFFSSLTSQSTSAQPTNMVDQLLALKEYNSKSDIAFNEQSFLNNILDNRSPSVRLPFLSEELTFTKNEYSIYGDKPSPYDEIKTYKIVCHEDPLLQGRIVTGPLGVNITYLYNGKMIKIYPLEKDGNRVYVQELGVSDPVGFACEAHGKVHAGSGLTTDIFNEETKNCLN